MPKQGSSPLQDEKNRVSARRSRIKMEKAMKRLKAALPAYATARHRHEIINAAADHLMALRLEINALRCRPPKPTVFGLDDPVTPPEPEDPFDHFSNPVSMPFEYPFPFEQ
jgi:hypothetical protein